MPEPIFPVIPEYITVHLGRPDAPAANVQVGFSDYIKNVASSEIYPTWPKSALEANILAEISYALNRVYTEHYRSKGYNFDITNTTQFDQAYQPGRDVFENISLIVDEIFNDYVRKGGSIEPYFTAFCNGTTSKCAGLSQWGTVKLAKEGKTPLEILRNYYGEDVFIVENAPVAAIEQSYPGNVLRLGTAGNEVLKIQLQLNRIRRNFPGIPQITAPDGNFGVQTEAAVVAFQRTFNLAPDGLVGKATWYKIREIYNGVKKLAELSSEGISAAEATPIFETELRIGSSGVEVQILQYYLSVLGYFNPALPQITVDGDFGEETRDAIFTLQSQFGLPITGEVDRATWNKILELYREILKSLPPELAGGRAKIFQGRTLKIGMTGEDVKAVQSYLALIAENDSAIPAPETDGVFGEKTESAVKAFQAANGLEATGVIGIVSWNKIAELYDRLIGI